MWLIYIYNRNYCCNIIGDNVTLIMSVQSLNNFHFKSFDNLDEDKDADFFINSMDALESIPSVRSIKDRAIDAMNLQIGDIVLEAGCGHGRDAQEIGKIVGNIGRVEAIDVSLKTINEAKVRYPNSNNVNFSVMSANDIKFANNYFSACHLDRLLVGHNNYDNMFAEILRTIKPKGIASVTDVDSLSIVMYPFNESTKKILKQIQRSFVNPFIGRMLPELFIKQNLKNIHTLPELITIEDFTILSKIFPFPNIINDMIHNDELTVTEGNSWIDSMYKATNDGRFLYCITLFTVIGQK